MESELDTSLAFASPAGSKFLWLLACLMRPALAEVESVDVGDSSAQTRAILDILDAPLGRQLDHESADRNLFSALASAASAANYWQAKARVQSTIEQPEVYTRLREQFAPPIALMQSTFSEASPVWHAAKASLKSKNCSPPDLMSALEATEISLQSEEGFVWWSAPYAIGGLQLAGQMNATLARRLRPLWDSEVDGDACHLQEAIPPFDKSSEYAIAEPSHWAQLVTNFPLEVTKSHGRAWGAFAQCEGERLFMPDYSLLSEHYSSVYLSPLGYLATAGLEIQVPGGFTILSGWAPGVHYALR